MPMISVCMATYNGEKFLKEQVDSILKQLSDGDELIISDDGSTDSTLEILTVYNDPRIKIFSNTKRKGVVGNFENSLSKASGDYIFLSDQDDVWLDCKVEKCVAKLQNCDLVLHDACGWDGDKYIWDSFFKLRGTKQGYWANILKNGYIGCCMAFTKQLKGATLPIPQSIAMHDVYIGLIAEKHYKIKFIKDKLLLYRRHGNNASCTGEDSSLSLCQKINYRINLIINTFFK